MKYQSRKHKVAIMTISYGASLGTVMRLTGYKKRMAKKRIKQVMSMSMNINCVPYFFS